MCTRTWGDARCHALFFRAGFDDTLDAGRLRAFRGDMTSDDAVPSQVRMGMAGTGRLLGYAPEGDR